MTKLSDFSLDQLAGAVALALSSVGALLLILFKSRCSTIEYSCLWGICRYNCMREVQNNSSDDEETPSENKDKKNVKKKKAQSESEPEPEPESITNP